MRKKRAKEKIEAIIQIVLLLIESFTFSFFISEALDSGIENVSAQQDSSQQGLTNDELTSLRERLPNYQRTNEQLNSTLNYLQVQGCLQRSEFTNTRAVSDAMRQCGENANSAIEQGDTSKPSTGFFGATLDSLGILPNTQSIPAGDVKKSLLDSTGGLSYCPE